MSVYVIILNYNGWGDTIECLESVFRSAYPDFRVVVCDNKSSDHSLDHVAAWAEGRLDALPDEPGRLRHYSFPPIAKPIEYTKLTQLEVENGTVGSSTAPLVLVQNSENAGFAAGNNVGLRYALSRPDCSYVWLLNNDTLIDTNAVGALVSRMEQEPRAGQCGSRIMFYHEPDRLQAPGGMDFSSWTCRPRPLKLPHRSSEAGITSFVERRMRYVVGAALFARADMVRRIGLMCEDYFLYFEEIDWAERGRKHFTLAYAPDSLVYHKEGASSGRDRKRRRTSRFSDQLYLENRLKIARKFFPWALPVVYAGLLYALVRRLFRGQPDRVTMILKIMARPFAKGPTRPWADDR